MQRIHLQCLLQNRDGLIELLHLLVANALKINGVRVPRIELHRILKAGQRRLHFIACVLGQAQVIPGLRAIRVERNPLLQRLLGLIKPLQSEQRNALIHLRLRQLRVLLERRGKTFRGALGKLLAHLRHAAIVEPHCLGVEARLRPRRGHSKKNKSQRPNHPHRSLSQNGRKTPTEKPLNPQHNREGCHATWIRVLTRVWPKPRPIILVL